MTPAEREALRQAYVKAKRAFGCYATVSRLPREGGGHIYQVGVFKERPVWTQIAPNHHRVEGVTVLGEGSDWATAFDQAMRSKAR